MFRTLMVDLVRSRISWIAACLVLAAWAAAQPAARAVIAQGEVTANNVYVRSGPSTNHYPVCKLQAGDRVQIVGDQGEWYEILPTSEAFSLIHADYVDSVDGRAGVVNGDNVLVRAGSALPEWSKQKYARQTKLSKGAEVTILGRNPEGYLQIEPPAGVTLWVHRSLVQPVPDELLRLEAEARGPIEIDVHAGDPVVESGAGAVGDDSAAIARRRAAAASGGTDNTVSSPLSSVLPTAQRRTLQEIDEATRTELDKPALQRQLKPLMDRYGKVVEQTEDTFAQLYAKARLRQLEHLAALIHTLRRMHELDEDLEAQRIKFMEQRANTNYSRLLPVQAGLDAQGELRTSALYPPGSQPQRYRLVDSTTGRTTGYVEIPPDSVLDVNAYLGRYVGVRASEKRLQIGGVNPVPIYVVRELTLLQPASLAGPSDGPS